MKFNQILFPTDFSPNAQAALVHALFHAESFAARLTVLHGLIAGEPSAPHDYLEPDEFSRRMEEVAAVQMKESLEAHKDRALDIYQTTIWGELASELILEYARQHDTDLIVMGTHGRKGLNRFFLGSVAEEVIRNAPCPVMTVRSKAGEARFEPLRHVVVPVDFSPISVEALQIARHVAILHKAKLTLLHVVEEYFYPGGLEAGIAPISEIIPDIKQKRLDMLNQLGQDHIQDEIEFHTVVTSGRASESIVNWADENQADFIALGTHGFGGLNRFFLGSTAERVVRKAQVPVCTIRPVSS